MHRILKVASISEAPSWGADIWARADRKRTPYDRHRPGTAPGSMAVYPIVASHTAALLPPRSRLVERRMLKARQ